MARPTKERRVEFLPEYNYFKPVGIHRKELEEIHLTIEEFEALRLKDLECLTQEEAAERMHISRPTFQRILTEARRKLTRALIEGYAIKFEGGNYLLAQKGYCKGCGREFKPGQRRRRRGTYCSDCDSKD